MVNIQKTNPFSYIFLGNFMKGKYMESVMASGQFYRRVISSVGERKMTASVIV